MSQQSERYVAYVLRAGCALSSAMLAYLEANQLPVQLKYVDFKQHVSCAPCLHDHATGRFLNVEDTVSRIKAMAKSTAEPDCTLYVHPDSPTSNKLLEYILATDLEIEVHDVQYLDYVRTVPALEDTELQLLYVARDALEACASLVPRADGGGDGGGDLCEGDFCPVGGGGGAASGSAADLCVDEQAAEGQFAEPDGRSRSAQAGATDGFDARRGGSTAPTAAPSHETAALSGGTATATLETATAALETATPSGGTAKAALETAASLGAAAAGEADVHEGAAREVGFPLQSAAVAHSVACAQTTGSPAISLARAEDVPNAVESRCVAARRPAVDAHALASARDSLVPKLSSAPSTPRTTDV